MLDFPNSPTTGQIYPTPAQAGIPQWKWDGTEWVPYSSTLSAALQVKQRVFTSATTYVPTPGMMFAEVICCGNGGGAGGAVGAANWLIGSCGGGPGVTASKWLTAAQIGAGQNITFGSQGIGGTGAVAGTTGGDVGFGSLVLGKGGNGSSYCSNAAGSAPVGSQAGSVGDLIQYGSPGAGPGLYLASPAAGNLWWNAQGGSSHMGSGGYGSYASSGGGVNGADAGGYGGGGAGAMAYNVAANYKGGNGAFGVCVVTEYGFFGLNIIPAGYVQRGALYGLTLSTGASTTFSIAPGQAADSNSGDYITLAAAMSKTTAAWAAGSGSGGLDTGTIANNTWYHIYLIKNVASGAVDVVYSLAGPGGPTTMPSGFTLFRRIGSLRIGGAGNWQGFVQFGDEFIWTARAVDAANLAWQTTAQLLTLTVPTGVQVNAMFDARTTFNTNAGAMIFTSPDEGDQAAGGSGFTSLAAASNATTNAARFNVRTDTSGRIRWRANTTLSTFDISTYGWIDTRGRLA
jgi:hypothetical protein